jgi:sodium/potassium/calcium exchanger 6
MSYSSISSDETKPTNPTDDYDIIHSIKNISKICDYLKENYDPDYFGLLKINYCYFGNRQYFTWPLIIIVLLLCFYFLSTSVDEYVSRILGRMSVKLNMSQNLAGLTLLAFGNQAVDIMVALVTGDDDNGGISSSLSTLLGADSLVIGLVLPTVIFLGNGVIVKGQNFLRDLLTYMFAILLVFSLGAFVKYLNIMFALIIFGSYIIYVGICIIMERIEKKKLLESKKDYDDNDSIDHDEQHDFKVQLFEDEDEKVNEKEDDGSELIKIKEKTDNKDKKNDDNISKDSKESKSSSIDSNKMKEKSQDENIKIDKEVEIKNKKEKTINDLTDFNIKDFFNDKYVLKLNQESERIHRTTSVLINQKHLVYNRLHYTLAKYYLNSKEEKWSEINIFQKIIKIIVEFPINIIRDLTIPPFEKEKWKREFFAVMPVTISLIISLFFGLFKYYIKYPNFIIVIIYYILAIILGIFMYHKTYKGSLPNCEWPLLIASVIMSMIWIYVITTILIQMVMDSRLLLPFKVNISFLIMTILAVGNALPDFLIDCTLSKSGYAEMALSGTIGSPVFSLLFGFGLSLLKTFALKTDRKDDFNLLDFDDQSHKLILCAMVGVFVNLVHYMIVFTLANFKVKRYASYAGYCIFLGYLTSLVLFSFVFNNKDESKATN